MTHVLQGYKAQQRNLQSPLNKVFRWALVMKENMIFAVIESSSKDLQTVTLVTSGIGFLCQNKPPYIEGSKGLPFLNLKNPEVKFCPKKIALQ